MNGYKLRTVSFYLRNHFAADSPSIANEEKNKRCSQGTVSLLSMTSPPAVPAPAQSLNTAADISPHMLAAQPPDEPTAMDVTTVPPSPPPYEAVAMNANIVPLSSPAYTGPPELPTGSPTPPLSPTADPMSALDPGKTPNEMREPTPTPALDANDIVPFLEAAGKGVFNFDTPGDFINEAILTYLEGVPGGEMWIEMVKNYQILARLPPAKGVGSRYSLFER